MRTFKCYDCSHTWQLPHGQGGMGSSLSCPECQSRNVHREPGDRGWGGRGAGWGEGERRVGPRSSGTGRGWGGRGARRGGVGGL
jgi:hypothetical protein